MTKRILSVMLAVLVLAAALPLGLVSADNVVVDKVYKMAVENEKVFNDFPTAADTLFTSPGVTSEGGLEKYAAFGEYDATTTGLKYTGEGTTGDKSVRIKASSFAGANMISFWVDTTGITTAESLSFRPSFDFGSSKNKTGDAARYYAPGVNSYFVADGGETVTVLEVAKNDNIWNTRLAIPAGVKGTVYIPEEAFQACTVENNGVDHTYPEGAWTSFGDEYISGTTYDWFMDGTNYTSANFTFGRVNMAATDSFIVDNFKYVEAALEEVIYVMDVEETKVINDVSAEASTELKEAPGAATDLTKYAQSSGFTVTYDETSTGAKFATTAEATSTVRLYVKNLSFADANMLSFTLDTTGIANSPDTADDDYVYVRPSFTYGDGKGWNARYYAGGVNLYFVADGSEAVEELKVGTASSEWNVRIPLKTGVKGTYYIPEAAFANTTAEVSGYVKTYDADKEAANTWQTFGDAFLADTTKAWVMTGNNYTSSSFCMEFLPLKADEYVIIDDLAYVNAAVIEKPEEGDGGEGGEGEGQIPAGPSYADFVIVESKIVNDFPTAADTLQASPGVKAELGKYAKLTSKESVTLSFDEASGALKIAEKGSADPEGFYAMIKNWAFDGANMFAFDIDTNGATGTDTDAITATFEIQFAPSKSGGKDTGRTLVAGEKYYFLDAATGKIEILTVGEGATISLKKGVKGTILIPQETVTPSTVAGAWTKFEYFQSAEDYRSWCMDNGNFQYTCILLHNMDMTTGESFLLDNMRFVRTGTAEELEAAKRFPYMNSGKYMDMSNAAALIEQNLLSAWGRITPDNFTIGKNSISVKVPVGEDNQCAMSFYASNRPADDDLAFSLYIDATGAAKDINTRLCLGYGTGGYRNSGGSAGYYLVPADGSDWVKKDFNSETIVIPAGFKGLLVVPFEGFKGGTGADNPVDVTVENMQKAEKINMSFYLTKVESESTVVFGDINYMKENDGSVLVPDMGVDNYVVLAIVLMVAAVLAAVVSLKKKAIED